MNSSDMIGRETFLMMIAETVVTRGQRAHAWNHSKRLAHWLLCSVVLIVVGEVIEAAGMPMNKQLWTSSYVFYMAGAILTSF